MLMSKILALGGERDIFRALCILASLVMVAAVAGAALLSALLKHLRKPKELPTKPSPDDEKNS